MTKKGLMVILFLTVSSIFASVEAKNFNLRSNNASTHLSVSGGFNVGFKSETTVGYTVAVSATRYHDWFHYGTEFGGDIANKTFYGRLFVGPKFGDKFYFAPSATFGLGQVRTRNVYQNLNNEDKLIYQFPQPKFLVGGQFRLGYNFGSVGIYLQAGYERSFSDAHNSVLEQPWIELERSSAKDHLNIGLGFSYIIDDDVMFSGDNCIISSLGGGYSSMGHFASIDVKGCNRLGPFIKHSYGAIFSFYTENGNAEIGGGYDLLIYPGGSDGRYNASIGITAVMGQYSRVWEGVANDDPERLFVKNSRWSLGGGADLEVTPVALQFGQVKLALFGSVGFRALNKVKGSGDLNYGASSISSAIIPHWKGGLKIEIAL